MIQYVDMKLKHVSQVAALEQLCFSHPWSESSIAAELVNPLSLWIVAVDADTVVGYVGSQAVLGEADMMNLAVVPRCRRNGVGEALVSCLIHRLRTAGVHCLTLEVRASNNCAKSLYQKLGFEQIGCRPNYYTGPKEDALILRKEWQL